MIKDAASESRTDPIGPPVRDPDFLRQLLLAASLFVLLLATLAYDYLRVKDLQFSNLSNQVKLNTAFHSNTVSQAVDEIVEQLQYIAEQFEANHAWRDAENRARILRGFNRSDKHLIDYSFVGFTGAQVGLMQTAARRSAPGSAAIGQAIRATASNSAFTIEPPVIGIIPDNGLLLISRRLVSPEGHFVGFLQATISKTLFEMRLGGIQNLGNGEVTQLLYLPTFKLLAQHSSGGSDSGILLSHDVIKNASAPEVVLRVTDSGPAYVEGTARVRASQAIAYQKLEGLPLAVLSGLPMDDMQAKLDMRGGLYILLAVLFVMVVTTAVFVKRRSTLNELSLKNDALQREALFKAFFETSTTGMFLMGRNLRYQWVNPAHEKSLGCKPGWLIGKTTSDVVLDAGELVTSRQRRVIEDGLSFSDIEVSSAIDNRPGEMKHWLSSYFPLYDGQGRITGLGAVVSDITERKILESELRKGRDLLSLVLDNLPVGVWISDKRGEIIRSNKEALRIFGCPDADTTSHEPRFKAFWSKNGKAVPDREYGLEWAIAHRMATVQNQFDIFCSDGTRKSLVNSAFPLIDAQGELLGGVEINEDVTIIKSAQDQVRDSKELVQKLFDSPGLAISISDLEGRIARVNDAMCALVGYSEDELLALSFLDITHPEDMVFAIERRKQLLAGKLPHLLLEKRYIRKNGKEVWVLISITVLRDERGAPTNTIGVILDISRLKSVESSLLDSKARLSNAQRMARIGDWEWSFENERFHYSDEMYRIYDLPSDSDLPHESSIGFLDGLVRVHPEDKALFSNYLDLRMSQPGVRDITYRIVLADGRVRYLQDRTELFLDDSGSPARLSGTVQDVTEQKLVELDLLKTREHLRTLSARHEAVVEEGRKHMAREIHDELVVSHR